MQGAVHDRGEGRRDDRRGDHGQARRQLRVAHARLGGRRRRHRRDAHRVRPHVANCARSRCRRVSRSSSPPITSTSRETTARSPSRSTRSYLGVPKASQAEHAGHGTDRLQRRNELAHRVERDEARLRRAFVVIVAARVNRGSSPRTSRPRFARWSTSTPTAAAAGERDHRPRIADQPRPERERERRDDRRDRRVARQAEHDEPHAGGDAADDRRDAEERAARRSRPSSRPCWKPRNSGR